MAENNPITNVDVHGLGILNVIGNLWKRLKNGVSNIFRDECNKKSVQESVRKAWIRPDFNTKKRKSKRKNKKSNGGSNGQNANNNVNNPQDLRPSVNPLEGFPFGPDISDNSSKSNLRLNSVNSRIVLPELPTGKIMPAGIMKLGGGRIGPAGNVEKFVGIDLSDGITLQMLNTIVNTLINNPDLSLEMNYIAPEVAYPGSTVRDGRARKSVNTINNHRHDILVRFLISKGIKGNRIKMIQKARGYQLFQFIPK